MKLFLAPMEGVTDWVMRDLLTEVGGIDQCVTEFLRVTDTLYPDSVFYKNCPELHTGSRTRSGTPVFVQLLGGHAEPLALNAKRAQELGALGIDLNFGCPAKTVNRHDGGATLLKYTDRIYKIVKTVRDAVPADTPVTAKIRLGFDDPSACLENAKAVEEAGANWLTVHCRTKTDGYKPPAYWEWIAKIKEVSSIRLVTNGEIWNVDDFKRCHEVAGTNDYMIGRGALKNPFLFQQIKQTAAQTLPLQKMSAVEFSRSTKFLLPRFYRSSQEHRHAEFAISRTKQWLKQLATEHAEFDALFNEIKIIKDPRQFQLQLEKMTSLSN